MMKISNLKKILKNQFNNLNSNQDDFYIDSCYFKSSETRISLDKTNTQIDKSSDEGIKLRVWDNSKFLEFGQTDLDENQINKQFEIILNQAKDNQKSIKEKIDLNMDKEIIEKDFITETINKEEYLSLEEKVNKLDKIKTKIIGLSKRIVNARVVLIEEEEETLFVNKYKNLYQKIPKKIFIMVAFVKAKDGTIKNAYESFVANDYSIFEKANNNFSKFVNDINNLEKATKLKGGKYEVVLAPKLTGLLAHESFGHGMEADTMMKQRALASNWVGKKIGSSEINIVDYPAMKNKNGEFYFDHEGNLAKKIYLVKNGIIQDPIADSYSKVKLNLKSSSNGRFESFDHKVYARMSNTYFEGSTNKDNTTVEDLISKIDDGIFVFSANGGMEDPKNWSVQIQGCSGQRIKNGKLVDEFYDGFSLTGFLPDIIGSVEGMTGDVEIDGGGSCGKGHKEWVRVSEGGPYMLVREVILG